MDYTLKILLTTYFMVLVVYPAIGVAIGLHMERAKARQGHGVVFGDLVPWACLWPFVLLNMLFEVRIFRKSGSPSASSADAYMATLEASNERAMEHGRATRHAGGSPDDNPYPRISRLGEVWMCAYLDEGEMT